VLTKNVNFKVLSAEKAHISLSETASFELSRVKICQAVWLCSLHVVL